MKIWLKGGRVIDPDTRTDQIADVLVENGKILAIGAQLAPEKSREAGERVIHVSGKWVTPGLVDIHTHLREPGYEYKETVASGTLSAARGGFTAIVCMANTQPVNDNSSVTEYILKKAKQAGYARVFPVGAVSKGLMGESLADYGDLKESGAVALSDDGKPVASSALMRHALEYAKNFDLPIISHCEDPALFCGGHMNEGLNSTRLGITGIPNACEDIMVSRDIELSALTQGRVHLAHLSTQGSARLLLQAKDRGLRVSGEVTPHHLLLNDSAVQGYDGNTKMNPPLRAEIDRELVFKALKDGVFDAIASDHAPHSVDEKEVEFDKAPFGIIGLETTVPLIMKLVHEGHLQPMQMIQLLTIGPSRVMGFSQVGRLAKGGPADIAVIDPELKFTVDRRAMASLSRNTPFDGWKLKGKTIMTFLGGEIVYEQST